MNEDFWLGGVCGVFLTLTVLVLIMLYHRG
jgi:hypothetical protein